MKLQVLVELRKVLEYRHGFVYLTESLGFYWVTEHHELEEGLTYFPAPNQVCRILKWQTTRYVDKQAPDLVEATEVMAHPLVSRFTSFKKKQEEVNATAH
jgi:hypothetical protein